MLRNYFDTYGILPKVRPEISSLAHHLCLVVGEPMTVRDGVAIWGVEMRAASHYRPPSFKPAFIAPVVSDVGKPVYYCRTKQDYMWVEATLDHVPRLLLPLYSLVLTQPKPHQAFLEHVLGTYAA